VVLRGGSVLLQQDRDSHHILPGGRREHDETLEATLRREILEETGWSLGAVRVAGFIHFRHLDPEPPAYPYPYPDFLQLIFAAEAIQYAEAAKLDDGYEVGSEFVSAGTAFGIVPEIQQMYLRAATNRAARS
jgi:ADP-ribose pyrophosphatase YjhB (NUDIX family)